MAKRGRRPKSAVIEADEPQKESIGVPKPEPQPESESLELGDDLQEPVSAVVVSDLPDPPLFDEPSLPAPVPDDVPSPDEGLTPAQKQEFVRLVRREMPLEERAKQLAVLARMRGTKTAAVGLRAIQFIAQLEGWTEDGDIQAPPMFELPEGTKVAVAIKVPDK